MTRDALENLQATAAREERCVSDVEAELEQLRRRVEEHRAVRARVDPLHRIRRAKFIAFTAALVVAFTLTLATARFWPWHFPGARPSPGDVHRPPTNPMPGFPLPR